MIWLHSDYILTTFCHSPCHCVCDDSFIGSNNIGFFFIGWNLKKIGLYVCRSFYLVVGWALIRPGYRNSVPHKIQLGNWFSAKTKQGRPALLVLSCLSIKCRRMIKISSNAEVEVWVHTKLDSTSKVCLSTKFIFQNIFQDIFVVKLFCISFKISHT